MSKSKIVMLLISIILLSIFFGINVYAGFYIACAYLLGVFIYSLPVEE